MIKVCPTCQQKYPEDTEFCAQDGTRLQELQEEGGDALLGRVLDGRWVIEERIGEGGMGAVYLASQRSVDRKVAIKTLRPELCNSREFVDRFFREARVASTIAHPHCVTILDFGQTDDGTLYLAMEYLEGMPLTHRLQHPDMTVREIIQICIQISSALAAAHDQNIIHRDLKPDNVFLLSISDGSTFIKVLDFGIAKVTDSEDQMTKTGQVFGTPEYMSPEQCRGDKLDGRSDLYSLGCILYRMLGGHPPFESDTPMAVLVSHVSERPRHVRELIERDDVPERLTDLCMQLLSKNADERPRDGQAVRATLEEIIGHTTTGASPAVGAKAPATSDEHISGPTMASDSAELVKDGGQHTSEPSQPSGSSQMPEQSQEPEPPQKQPADMQSAVNSSEQPVAQRTDAASGHTTSPPAVAAPAQKKSMLPMILGVGVAVLLAAGCAVGGLYWGYTNYFAEDGESLSIAGLFGGDEEAADDSESSDDESADDEATADNEPGDDSKSDDDAPANTGSDDDSNSNDGEKVASNDKTDDSDDSADDESKGGKAGDSDESQGGKQNDDGANGGNSGEEATASNDDSGDDTSKSGGTTKIEINADKAEIAVNDKNDDDSSGGDSSGDDSDDGPAVGDGSHVSATTDTKPDEDEKEEAKKPEPAGNIRTVKISAGGPYCVEPNVNRVMSGARSSFLSCYSKHLSSSPGAKGKVILAWNISTDGGILAPEALVSEVSEINSCLLGKLKRLNFDPPAGGRCYVRATYRFYP